MTRIRVTVVGASGYTGAELCRILLVHPHVELVELVGHGKAGQPIATVLPSLVGLVDGQVATFDPDRIAQKSDVAFSCLPHGASAKVVKELRARGLTVFDLSADFRLTDLAEHEAWYGHHDAPELRAEAVYGLVELHRESLRRADLVAVPGCFPTATILSLAPIFEAGLAEPQLLIVDAKSGVSGAGRSPSERTHYSETAESFRAYKIGGSHRHTSEMEQELARAAGGKKIPVSFVPHLVPMTRGILASSYLRLRDGVDAERITGVARERYAGSPSVAVLPPGSCPDTLWVRGSNRAHLSYTVDPRTNLLHVQGAIDNLVKGASGQAVQCFNVRFGFEEGTALSAPAMWP